MKILVTGGNGFLGSNVAKALTNEGHKVTIIDIKKPPKKFFKKKISFFKGSIKNRKFLNTHIKNKDVIYHFAGMPGIGECLDKPIETIKNNLEPTVEILKSCLKHNVKRIIYASTIYVNSEQGGFYKSSKRAAEDYIEEFSKKYNLNFTILRFGTIYGENASKENTIRNIIKNSNQTGIISYLGFKKNMREYLNVKDAAKMSALCLKKNYKNKFVYLTGKKKYSIKTVCQMIKKITKNKNKIIFKSKKLPGHYIKNPYTFKPRSGIKLKLSKYINLENGIKSILNNEF